MPVPSVITDLSTTAASNYPQGTDSPSTLDDVQRAHGSFIAQIRDAVPVASGGNLNFTGTGNRITGDFSNATVANRVMFQTSTFSSPTDIGVMPSGSAGRASFNLYSVSDPNNAHVFTVSSIYNSEIRFAASYTGTPSSGTYLPMTFYTGGSERMRIDTSGNVGIGGANTSGNKLDIKGGSWGNNQNIGLTISTPAGANGWLTGIKLKSDASGIPRLAFDFPNSSTFGNQEGFILDTNGNVLVTNAGGLGYGTGAGGTVTQATSRTTAVTLNKPTGQITMFSAAGTATWQFFTVNNSLVTNKDAVVLSVTGASNVYSLQAIGMAAGSFIVAFASVLGTATDAPVINFTVIKGANA